MRLVPENDFPELQRNPDSGVWYVRKWVHGKAKLQTTGERNSKARAKQIALRILSEWIGKPVKGFIPTFKDEAAEFLRLKANKAPATIYGARNTIEKHLLPFFGHMRIDEVTESTFEEYVLERQNEDPERKLFDHWKHFSGIMKRAYRRGLVSRPIVVKNPDKETKAGKVYTRKEEVRILRAAKPHQRLQILMGIKMGMRNGEILGLTTARIDLESNFIRLEAADTKTRYARVIPIHPRVLTLLKRRLTNLKGHAIFPTPGDPNTPVSRRGNKTSWRNIKRRAGVRGRFHDLRHTCATRMAESNINPVIAARILGMGLDVYDKVYCKPSEDALSKAMKEMVKLGK